MNITKAMEIFIKIIMALNKEQTVCETYEYIWDPFSRMLHRRYNFYSNERPSFATIQTEWGNYLLLRKDIEDYKKLNNID